MDTVWSVVQGVGAVVGLATGIFVLLDRLSRERPTAYLVAFSRSNVATPEIHLRIINNSLKTILVQIENREDDEVLLSSSDTTPAILDAHLGETVILPIAGKTEHDLVLLNPDPRDAAPHKTYVASVQWRWAEEPLFLRANWWRLTVRFTGKNLAYLTAQRD